MATSGAGRLGSRRSLSFVGASFPERQALVAKTLQSFLPFHSYHHPQPHHRRQKVEAQTSVVSFLFFFCISFVSAALSLPAVLGHCEQSCTEYMTRWLCAQYRDFLWLSATYAPTHTPPHAHRRLSPASSCCSGQAKRFTSLSLCAFSSCRQEPLYSSLIVIQLQLAFPRYFRALFSTQ